MQKYSPGSWRLRRIMAAIAWAFFLPAVFMRMKDSFPMQPWHRGLRADGKEGQEGVVEPLAIRHHHPLPGGGGGEKQSPRPVLPPRDSFVRTIPCFRSRPSTHPFSPHPPAPPSSRPRRSSSPSPRGCARNNKYVFLLLRRQEVVEEIPGTIPTSPGAPSAPLLSLFPVPFPVSAVVVVDVDVVVCIVFIARGKPSEWPGKWERGQGDEGGRERPAGCCDGGDGRQAGWLGGGGCQRQRRA